MPTELLGVAGVAVLNTPTSFVCYRPFPASTACSPTFPRLFDISPRVHPLRLT